MSNTHVVLKGSQRYRRPGTEIISRADAHEWCEVTVELRRSSALPEPDTKTGRPVLTRAQLADQYGTDPADIAEAALTAQGLTLVSKNPGACRMKFAGPAEAMEQVNTYTDKLPR